MTNTVRGRLLAVTLILGSAVPGLAGQRVPQVQSGPPQRPAPGSPISLPPPPPFPWWKSEQDRKELRLTADQSTRIDKIWEVTRPELRQEWDELTKLEDKLSRLIQNDADEAVLARQIDRVETARASANKTRSLMLVQMMKVLTPDQRTRLTALHERYMQELQKQQSQSSHGAPPPVMQPQPKKP
jgi:Spy/CpxP family protein refolding chaperone